MRKKHGLDDIKDSDFSENNVDAATIAVISRQADEDDVVQADKDDGVVVVESLASRQRAILLAAHVGQSVRQPVIMRV